MHGGVPNKEFNENNNQYILDLDKELSYILNELERNRAPLDDPGNIKYIISLLEKGANRSTQNNGKTLSDYLDEKLSDILDQLKSNSNLLNGYTQYIMFLLEAGANRNTQNQDGKTLLHYVTERNDTNGISFFLEKGANPNVQDRSGKTPLDYAAKNNCLQAIELLSEAGANQSVRDQDGKIPSEYVNNCLQAIDSDSEKGSDYYSDDSRESEGNPTTPDSSVDDCSNSSGDDNKTISTEPSDCDPEDEDSSCSSSDYLFLEDSLLAKLEIPLTTDEQKLIDEFCEKIREITAQNKQESEESILESIEGIVEKRLKGGPRLNSCCSCCKKTVTNSILEEIGDVLNNRVRPRDGTREYIGGVRACPQTSKFKNIPSAT